MSFYVGEKNIKVSAVNVYGGTFITPVNTVCVSPPVVPEVHVSILSDLETTPQFFIELSLA